MKLSLFTITLSNNLICSIDDSEAKLMKITNLLPTITTKDFYPQNTVSFDNPYVKCVASRDFVSNIKVQKLKG